MSSVKSLSILTWTVTEDAGKDLCVEEDLSGHEPGQLTTHQTVAASQVDRLDEGGHCVGDVLVPDDEIHQLDVRVLPAVRKISDVLNPAVSVVAAEDRPEVLQQ